MAVVNPPGGALDIAFSFDTTGSMNKVLEEVRGRLKDMIQRLQADIPGIRIAVFAHGDYCDTDTYVTKYIDFSTDLVELCEFVKDVDSTYGGDDDECYELVLREVREKLSWLPTTNKALVMIGDACPHRPSYPQNTDNINWRDETKLLANMGVKIYGVHCDTCNKSKAFFETLARKTGGRYVQLGDFSNIFDLIMAICYREHGVEFLQAYEKEVRERNDGASTSRDMLGVFGALGDGTTTPDTFDSPSASTKAMTTKHRLTKKGSKMVPCSPLKKVKSFKDKIAKNPTAKKKTTQPSKKKVRTIEWKFRENINSDNFVLKERPWSPWKLAMAPKPPSKKSKEWKKRRYGQGYRLRRLFKEYPSLSLYEIASQEESSAKKSVVRALMSKREYELPNWESLMFGPYKLRTQVNRVVTEGGKIFIRRLPLEAKDSAVEMVKQLKRYDYAWSSIHGLRITPRHMVLHKI